MAEPSINTTRLYALLRKIAKREEFSSVETNELSNEIFNMAGINLKDQFGPKLDAITEISRAQLESFKESNQAQLESFQAQIESFKESHQTQMDALRESNRTTRWLLGIGFTIIGVMIAYGNFFGG